MRGAITDEHSNPTLQQEAKQQRQPKDIQVRSGAESARTAEAERAIGEALALDVGSKKYQIWFKDSTRFTLVPPHKGDPSGYLKIGVPNLFIAGWIENHFSEQISQAVRSVTGANPKISFAVDQGLSGNIQRTQLDSQAELIEKTLNQRHDRRAGIRPPSGKKLKLSLDTFVVGPSNELAYSAAKAVVKEKQSPFNPLFIHGGYGLGKTHLLQGICCELRRTRPEANWLYLSAEDFANQFVLALKTKKLEAFRRRMRRTDLLAIDDIHFLANKPSTQEEFLYTFNTINLAGRQVVMVSDAHPKLITQLSEKLVNRFVSGMVVKIEPPDLRTRCQICRQFATNIKTKSSEVPESVIRYIASNLRNNVRELEGALLKVIAYSALQNSRISLSMAQAVLAEHLERCDPIVHVSDIESAVATYFGITPANIHSSKKDKTLVLARRFSMYLTRKHTKMSSAEIGRVMGDKNHATVLVACKEIESLIERNAEIRWQGPVGNKVAKARTVLASLEARL